MMGHGAEFGFGFAGPLALLGCVFVVVGIVVLFAWALGRVGNHGRVAEAPTQAPRTASPDAIEVLRLRFARGEITTDEYLAAKLVLEGER